jgi:predicted site-specific integrase-resolvase
MKSLINRFFKSKHNNKPKINIHEQVHLSECSSQDTESERGNTQELSENLISMFTIFVVRHNGRRAAEKRKRRRRERAAEEETETSSKEARMKEDSK